MFILTETGHSINTDFIKTISCGEIVGDNMSFIIKATNIDDDVFYLTRTQKLCEAISYIAELQKRINEAQGVEYNE